MSIKDDVGMTEADERGMPSAETNEGATTLTQEAAYWRAKHASQPYARESGRPFEDYERGYRTGFVGFRRGTTFSEREAELRAAYEQDHPAEVPGTMQHAMSTHPLRWADARAAAAAAYDRMAQLTGASEP
ncbi:MAG: hypothetical protein JSR82_08210 [Verrucomicrobia bacterium]|nr:hypothetical protein [Verrucomicrobiota bacterium]